MGTMIRSGSDVISFLKEQHEQIKAEFDKVLVARGEARTKAFVALRRLLAVHETAEEEIVHPAARIHVPDGDRVIAARLHEENAAKKALVVLETLDTSGPEFETQLRALKASVVAHASSEEREEFALLATKLDTSRLDKMRKAVEFAESVAPTRPHPGIESATANLLVGPFASMIDRARDAIAGKS